MSKKSEIERLKNLGPESTKWLGSIGITTKKDLEQHTIPEVYWKLKKKGYRVSKVMLYALYGALHDMHWLAVPKKEKDRLVQEVENMKPKSGS